MHTSLYMKVQNSMIFFIEKSNLRKKNNLKIPDSTHLYEHAIILFEPESTPICTLCCPLFEESIKFYQVTYILQQKKYAIPTYKTLFSLERVVFVLKYPYKRYIIHCYICTRKQPCAPRSCNLYERIALCHLLSKL